MSAVVAVPELMAEAATDLATVGSNLSAAHMTAAAATLTVVPAAADEVSASIAHLFAGYATEYQKLAGKAAAFHDQFVQHVTASASAYASAEAANVSLLTAGPAASSSLLDPFINLSMFVSVLINVYSENPGYFLNFVLPIILIFGGLGLLGLPFYLLVFSPFFLLDALLFLSHATIGLP